MISEKVINSIVENIQEFNLEERKRFIKELVDETVLNIMSGEDDLIDCINVKNIDDYWSLDTAVEDRYLRAYFHMMS